MAFEWIGATTAFGSVVRNANTSVVTYERAAFVERKPDRSFFAVRPGFILRERCEWDDAAVCWPEPPPPMRRGRVAHIGDAGISRPALEREDERRHAPPRSG